MSENSNSERGFAVNSHETSEKEGPEIGVLNQQEVTERIKSFIAPLMR